MECAGLRLSQINEQVKNTTLCSEIKVLMAFSFKPPGANTVYFIVDIVFLPYKFCKI